PRSSVPGSSAIASTGKPSRLLFPYATRAIGGELAVPEKSQRSTTKPYATVCTEPDSASAIQKEAFFMARPLSIFRLGGRRAALRTEAGVLVGPTRWRSKLGILD